jgi:uncharacterized SAM-binding protein YcdF (DUF218 family)
MFALKKLVSALLLPMPLALGLLAVGLALLWFTQRQRAGKVLMSVGFGLLVVLSLPIVADGLTAPLERGQDALYPAERLTAATAGRHPRWVVVLGGGHVPDPRVPPIDQLGASALARVCEGIRLYRALPGTKLVLSGGPDGISSHADILAQTAISLGVPEADLVLDRTTRDTEDEAEKLTRVVGKDDFVLVTAASHMPRALALFRARGVSPIPAPAHHTVTRSADGVGVEDLFPHPGALGKLDAAEHEYLGRVWARLRGKS